VVNQISDKEFVVYINEIPEKGRANEAVADTLSDFFDVPKSAIKIIAGHKGRQKLVEILGL